MKKLIFLDDERVVEDVTWLDYNQLFSSITVLRTYNEFKEWCDSLCHFSVDLQDYVFSFDHDLACFDKEGNEYTGYHAAQYLCDTIVDMSLEPNDLTWFVHSMNPIGKENINCYIENFIKFMRT